MPEGPEIWRTADKLNKALKDKEVTKCFFYHDELKSYESKIVEQKVVRVEPRAKALIMYFDTEFCLYTHNQLYGKWFIKPAGEKPKTSRSLRLVLENSDYAALLYSASEIEVLPKSELEQHSYLQKLGPDVVHPETTVEDILAQYQSGEFQNRKLATLLLDQGFLSGVGNYLRAEILFYAGVHPSLKLRECTPEQKKELAEATRLLARRSYKQKGVTADPEIVEALKREGASWKEYRHFVYNRTEHFCHKCGTEIEQDKTGGRTIYYCPSCQGLD